MCVVACAEVSEVMAEAFKMVPWHRFWGCGCKGHKMTLFESENNGKSKPLACLLFLKILWREGHSLLRATNDHCSYLVMRWLSPAVRISRHFNCCPSKVPGTICCTTLRSWCCHNAWHNAARNRPWVYLATFMFKPFSECSRPSQTFFF